ncbi:MAG: hypothetical protein U9R52_04360, partial [Candidatus Omnitrophota bacterium]|nr:hypothetical protein [Candidatus Omnitrophota bacterium]
LLVYTKPGKDTEGLQADAFIELSSLGCDTDMDPRFTAASPVVGKGFRENNSSAVKKIDKKDGFSGDKKGGISKELSSKQRPKEYMLYQRTIKEMFGKTVGSVKGTDRGWICFAGELLHHPSTLQYGIYLLKEVYGRLLKNRGDRNIWDLILDAYLAELKEIIAQLGKHRDSRPEAIKIIFDPRLYRVELISEIFGNRTAPAAGQRQEDNPSATNLPARQSRAVAAAAAKNSMLWIRALFPIKWRDYDSEAFKMAIDLIKELVKNIGDDDVELSEKLLDICKEPALRYCASEEMEYWAITPNEEDNDNALIELIDDYVKAGRLDKAFTAFLKIKDFSPSYKFRYHFVRNFAKIAVEHAYRKQVLRHTRKIAGAHLLEWLIAAGNALYEKGKREEAYALYQEAWRRSFWSKRHPENVCDYFIALAREKKITFKWFMLRQNAEELLEEARVFSEEWLKNEYTCNMFPPFWARKTIFELTIAGRYKEAEYIIELIEKKYREYMGDEERDRGLQAMAKALAQRGDLKRASEYLEKMINFRPETTLEITELLAKKGDYDNALVASILN